MRVHGRVGSGGGGRDVGCEEGVDFGGTGVVRRGPVEVNFAAGEGCFGALLVIPRNQGAIGEREERAGMVSAELVSREGEWGEPLTFRLSAILAPRYLVAFNAAFNGAGAAIAAC